MITIPTLQQLQSDIQSDLETEFEDTLPSWGKNFLRALSAVQAAVLWVFYKAIALLQKNVFPDTAEPASVGGKLDRFGLVKLGRPRFTATAGYYEISVTGDIGAVIEVGTTFKSDDNSANPEKLFIVDTNFELESSPDTLVVRALETGLDSRMNVGETMTCTIPIAGVARGASVVTETVIPLAAETVEAYRAKILAAFRTEANGGAAADYRLWASDAQGVETVYAYARTGYPSEVNLYVEATQIDSLDGRGTPTPAILEAVEAVVEFDPDTTKPIDERGRRPLQAVVHFLPVTVREVIITIPGYVGLTAEIQNLIELGLEDLVSSVRPFVSGADILADKNDILDINSIIGAILRAKPSSVFGTPTMTVGGSPSISTTFVNGDIPFLVSVSFT